MNQNRDPQNTLDTLAGLLEEVLQRVEERLRMANEQNQQANERSNVIFELWRATNARTNALMMNQERKMKNSCAYVLLHSPLTPLQPLVDLRTGVVIPHFPRTLHDLQELDELTAAAILSALEEPSNGFDVGTMRETIRSHTL